MIQKPCKLFSNAKINLTLDITGTDGGYHTLDSLAVEIDLGNDIEAVKTRDGEISIEFVGSEYEIPSVPANETNAYKAAKLFAETFHTGGAKITVYSVIPVGAGWAARRRTRRACSARCGSCISKKPRPKPRKKF